MFSITIRRFVVVLAVVVGIVVTTNGESRPSPEQTDAEKAVLARLSEIQAAAQSLDPDKLFSFVLENDKGALVQNGKLFRTRHDALQSTKQGFRGLSKIDYRFDQQHVALLSPTVAVVTGEGLTSATTEGGRMLSTRFAQTVVLRLVDGDWKVFHAHRSFPPTN